jgi:hypothetical protein
MAPAPYRFRTREIGSTDPTGAADAVLTVPSMGWLEERKGPCREQKGPLLSKSDLFAVETPL